MMLVAIIASEAKNLKRARLKQAGKTESGNSPQDKTERLNLPLIDNGEYYFSRSVTYYLLGERSLDRQDIPVPVNYSICLGVNNTN